MFVVVLVLATTVQAVRGIVLDDAVHHWALDEAVYATVAADTVKWWPGHELTLKGLSLIHI